MASGELQRDISTNRCLLLTLLCSERGLGLEDLQRTFQLPMRQLKRFEEGTEAPPWELLYAIAASEEMPLFMVPELHWYLLGQPRTSGPALKYDYQDEQELRRTGTGLVRSLSELPDPRLCGPVEAAAGLDPALAALVAEERERAAEQWAALRNDHTLEWHKLPGCRTELHSWALAERLCHESARRAVQEDPELSTRSRLWTAEKYAGVGLRIACMVVGVPWDPVGHQVREYAWAHVGHVRRIAGEREGAEEAFYYADEHFALAAAYGPLAAARPFLYKALLRRDQGRLDEAIDLLQRAAVLAGPDDPGPAVALAEAHLLRGEADAAAAALEPALERAPRAEHWWAGEVLRLAFELAARQAGAGRVAEGAALLERAAPLAERARARPGVAALASVFVKLAAKGRLDAARAEALWNDFRALTGPRPGER